MFLVFQFLSYGGASLRSCRHFLLELFFCLGLEMSVPSHATIRIWVCKIGYYNYAKDKPCEDLIILIDESVTLGENKALLVLGFPSSLLNCSRPLQHSDVHLLHFSVGHSWKKEKISEVIRSIQKNYKIVYSISDRGNNLRGAYKVLNLAYVPDCTHVMALALQHYFTNNEEAKSFLTMSGKLRQKWNLGKKTLFIPPAQRTKARFQNISILIDWGDKILKNWQSLSQDIQKELIWFKDKAIVFQELKTIRTFISFVSKQLKYFAYNVLTQKKITDYLRSKTFLNCLRIHLRFLDEIQAYLSELEKTKQELKLPQENLMCCSDIIESVFGKMKYVISTNSSFGFTEYTMAKANLSMAKADIKKAMESVKESDLAKFREQNFAKSLFQKRKKAFQKVGEEITIN